MLSMNIRMGSLTRLQESLRNLDDGDVKLRLVVHGDHGIRETLRTFRTVLLHRYLCLLQNIHASLNASLGGFSRTCYGHGKISHST